LRDIQRTLDTLLPQGINFLITVARRDRLKPTMTERPCLVSDETVWEGSEAAWRDALRHWFARREWRKYAGTFPVRIG